MHFVVKRLLFLLFLSLFLVACSTTPLASTDGANNVHYLASVDISKDMTEAELTSLYGGEIVSFLPEAGFAVLGFNKEEGELSLLNTTANQDTFESPEMTMSGQSAWASGFSAWAGGWSAWAGGWSAWAGGFSAWAGGWGVWVGGESDSQVQTNENAWDQIKLEEAHVISRNFGEGIKIAVIDSGIDRNHPMFEGRLSPSSDWWDYVDNDNNPQESSSGKGKGHGTAVSSIILQIAPNAKIMPLRVLDSNGKGDTDHVVKAIQRAVDKGADVINISLGSSQFDNALYQMAAYANNKGIMIFASSGNKGGNNTMTYPGSFSWLSGNAFGRTIGIGSVNQNNKLSSFTSYGHHLYGVAPGEGVIAAYPENRSVRVKGTSFAAPMFTGAIALALGERKTEAERHNVTNYLWDSLDNSTAALNNGVTGARLLNVEELIRQLPSFTEPMYQIYNVQSNKCLSVQNASLANGGNIQQQGCDTSTKQKWKLEPTDSQGYYKIKNVKSSKVLDVNSSSNNDGANVQQWSYLGKNSQKWSLVLNEDSFNMIAKHSNKCLDVSNDSTATGANIKQEHCNDGNSQMFRLRLMN